MFLVLQQEGQEAIPLEYLDEQITISEQPSGSIQIKNDGTIDIKTEPDANYDHQTMLEPDRDNDEDDDKPISELMNFTKTNSDNGNDSKETVSQKRVYTDEGECSSGSFYLWFFKSL